MNPYTVIEHIPSKWRSLNVAIYHAYGNHFRMNNKLNIKVMPMSTINTKDAPWTTIWSTSWPLPGYQHKPKNEIIREVVTDV